MEIENVHSENCQSIIWLVFCNRWFFRFGRRDGMCIRLRCSGLEVLDCKWFGANDLDEGSVAGVAAAMSRRMARKVFDLAIRDSSEATGRAVLRNAVLRVGAAAGIGTLVGIAIMSDWERTLCEEYVIPAWNAISEES